MTSDAAPPAHTPLCLGQDPDRHRPAHGAPAQEGAAAAARRAAEPRVIDLLWHTPTGVIDRRATPTIAEAVPGTIATLEVRVLKHKPAARQHPGALQGGLRGRHGQASTSCSSMPSASSSSGSCPIGQHPLRQRPHRKLQRQASRWRIPTTSCAPEARADLPMLEPVYPLTAGLSGKILLKAGRQALERVARAAGVAGRGLAQAARLAGLPRGAAAPAPPRGGRPTSRRRRAPWQRLAYDELLAGQLALALVRQSLKIAARPQRRRATAASAPGSPTRCPSRLTNSQRQALAGDRRGHGRPAPHAAAAAGRRRLGQDGGGADGHGDRGGGRRAGRADGADRGAGAPARRNHRAAGRRRRACASALLTGREKGRTRAELLRAARRRRDRHPDRHARAVPGRTSRSRTWPSPSSTSSTASACTSGCRCRPRAARAAPTCWS